MPISSVYWVASIHSLEHNHFCCFELVYTAINFSSAGEDYVEIPPSEPVVLQFDPSNSERMVDIGIIDNPPLEPIEMFFGELTTSFSTVELDPQRANISIIDNDGKLEECIESTLRNTFMYNQVCFM